VNPNLQKKSCTSLSALSKTLKSIFPPRWILLICFASVTLAQSTLGNRAEGHSRNPAPANVPTFRSAPAATVQIQDRPVSPRDRFGRTRLISWPLYLVLRFLYAHVTKNWGTAIILLTALFNVVMIWPRLMSLKSSAKMARLQPQIAEIRKRYPKASLSSQAQAEMNNQIMALYKSEDVNLFGGCLPVLLQMPLLFGLFSVFQNAVELAGARWMWLVDLSKPDPLYILPTIIIGSMVMTQFITPSPGLDVGQRRAVAIVSALIFGFGLARYASGIALYWATGNVINLLIQFGLNRSGFGADKNPVAGEQRQE